MKALLTLFLLLSALLFSASSIAAQSIGSKGGGGSRSGTPVTGNRPPAAVPAVADHLLLASQSPQRSVILLSSVIAPKLNKV
ncbi:hypothetical protein QUC31_017332 [Theobroma cacao]